MQNLVLKATRAFFVERRWISTLRESILWAAIGLATPVGANPDLHPLAVQPSNAVLESALAAGADPEQLSATFELPLMAAVKVKRMDSVKALLGAGADPDGTNRLGESSLHVAAAGDSGILKSLLDAGANPNARDAGGVTPMMLAAAAGREYNLRLFRNSGARLDVKDYQGSSFKDWAVRGGHMALAARLESELAASVAPAAGKITGVDFAEDVFMDVLFPDWFKISILDLREDLDEARGPKSEPIIVDDLFENPPYMLDRSVTSAQRPMLVLFERPGCTACERFHQRVLRDKTIRKLIGEYEAVQLNANDAQGRVVTSDGKKTSWWASPRIPR